MRIKIMYATEVGTTKYVAELLQSKFEKEGHQVELFQAESQNSEPGIEGFDLLLFGSPTYYNGQPQENMSRLLTSFNPELSSYKVAVFCLGDSGYDHFCGAAETIENWIQQHGGQLLVPTLKIDGYPLDITPISQWVTSILSQK